ncbi:MAG TPA: hypothetical protein VKO63_10535 [Chitinispirillaceae bacterium]|nr:hypothetical protein [Chitinispirillaceae bacterium]
MIWTILLIITALIALVFCFIVFMPLGVSFQFTNSSKKNHLNAFFFLFNGFFLRVEYDFAVNSMIIKLFGRKLDFTKKDNSPKDQQDDRIGKGKKVETEVKVEEERKKKAEIKVKDKKTEHYKAVVENDGLVVPSGTAGVNQSNSNPGNGQYQSLYTESIGEASGPTPETQSKAEQKPEEVQTTEPKVQQRTKPEQREKKKRLADTIDQIKSRINRHPAVFFLKQEKLRYRGWRWIVRILKSILRILVIRRLLVRTELVFDDPALGGKLFGYYESVRHAAALYSKKINLFFKPIFIMGDTRIDIDFRVTTSLWKIGLPLLVAVVTFPYMTFGITWWRFYKMNRQQKKADAKRN